jgi:hypothetical protein
MANEGLEGNITIDKIYEKMDGSNNKYTVVSAIVTFERGDKTTARLIFELISPATNNSNNSKSNINTIKMRKRLTVYIFNIQIS